MNLRPQSAIVIARDWLSGGNSGLHIGGSWVLAVDMVYQSEEQCKRKCKHFIDIGRDVQLNVYPEQLWYEKQQRHLL